MKAKDRFYILTLLSIGMRAKDRFLCYIGFAENRHEGKGSFLIYIDFAEYRVEGK